MRVRKVTGSKNDLQGRSQSLVLMPFDRPHTIFYSLSIQLCLNRVPFPRCCESFTKN